MTTILDIHLDSINYLQAVEKIMMWTGSPHGRYVCIANVHMLMEAHDSKAFRQIVNSADLVVPDGMPLVWIMRLKGVGAQTRVYGPALMLHLLTAAAKEKVPIGLLGGKPEVLAQLVSRLKERFAHLIVAYSFSPPFHEVDKKEGENIVREINASGARILFVGLGCPKQEIWMAAHRDRINAVMLGVGAAFDFHAGAKPQAPAWLQILGLEWLFRLLVEPRRLWRRYLYYNPRFLYLAVADLYRHFKGQRH